MRGSDHAGSEGFCVCGRVTGGGSSGTVEELSEALADVVERKLELARQIYADPRVLPEMKSLRREEKELRAALSTALRENSTKTR